jgi:hypothetical protein
MSIYEEVRARRRRAANTNGMAIGQGAAQARSSDEAEPANLTDEGNARRLISRDGKDLRYCCPWRKWLVWGGGRWRVDDVLKATERVKAMADELYRETIKRMEVVA